jgi:hypothetical protein
MRANRLQGGVEGLRGAPQPLQAGGAGHFGGVHQPLGPQEGQRTDASHGLRSVVEREALLGRQPHRLQPGAGQRLPARQHLAAHLRLSFAHQHEGEVGERRQVPGGAHGSLLRDHRVDAPVQKLEEEVDHLRPYAGVALGEDVGAQEGDGAGLGAGERAADAAGVAADEVQLELLQAVGGDDRLGEAAKAGGEPVDHAVLADRAVHYLAGALDPAAGIGGKSDRPARFPADRLQPFQREGSAVEREGFDVHACEVREPWSLAGRKVGARPLPGKPPWPTAPGGCGTPRASGAPSRRPGSTAPPHHGPRRSP